MEFFDRKLIASAMVGAAAVVGLAAFITLPSMCATGETSAACAREWLSSFSGYVAAAGALFAAWLTIPVLRKQVREAEKQTAFVVGDGSPTLTIAPFKDIDRVSSYTFRVVNWNRRPILISEIRLEVASETGERFSSSPTAFHNERGAVDEPVYEPMTYHRSYRYREPFFISGWEDRSGRPPYLEAEVIVGLEEGRQLLRPAHRTVSATIVGNQIGETHEHLILSTSGIVSII